MAVGVEMLSGRPQAAADKPGRRRVMMILSEAPTPAAKQN